jgi:2-methylcitrate dehydratase PrpD
MNITDQFVNNIIAFSNRSFSEEVLHHAKKCYLDYLGCVLGGRKQNEGKISQLLSSGLFENGDCTVLGTDIKLAFRDAGFVNGFNAHAMEMDDGHRYAMLHVEAPIFSAMTALYEKEHLSVEAFYKGVIVGYEATVRMSRALQPWHKVRGFHSTGTCATIGVAMAVAMALNYDYDQTKAALSAAASSAAGLLELLHDDSEIKPYNVARAVMDGLTAAYFGKVGYIPPFDVLGGKRGFLNIMSDTQHKEFLEVFDDNENPCILGNFFKPYPACRHCHSTIDAALQIARENSIDPKDIEKIKIGVYKLALTGHDHTDVKTTKSAMMSIPYGAVVSLVKKEAGLPQFDEGVVLSPDIQNLLQKVEIKEDVELTNLLPDVRGSKVEVVANGNYYNSRVDYSLGEPENPMSDRDIIEKFNELAVFAGLDTNTALKMADSVYNGKIITKI